MQSRHLLLGLALAATLAATAWFASDDDGIAAPVRNARGDAEAKAGSGRGARPADTRLEAPGPESLDRAALAADGPDLFAVHDWTPPPAPVAAVAPKPVAPPLPFKYVGRLIEDGATLVFLAAGNRTLLVRPGDRLEGQYRLDSIDAQGIAFTYEPLAERQLLPIGNSN